MSTEMRQGRLLLRLNLFQPFLDLVDPYPGNQMRSLIEVEPGLSIVALVLVDDAARKERARVIRLEAQGFIAVLKGAVVVVFVDIG